MRFSVEEMETAYQELHRNQKPISAILGGLAGLIPALVIYLFFVEMGGVLAIFLAIPPAIIGFFARFSGRTFRTKHRIPVGFIAAFAHIGGCYLAGFHPMIFLLAPVAFGIAMMTSKIKLERVHLWALDEAELGRLNINKPNNID